MLLVVHCETILKQNTMFFVLHCERCEIISDFFIYIIHNYEKNSSSNVAQRLQAIYKHV